MVFKKAKTSPSSILFTEQASIFPGRADSKDNQMC